MHNKLKGKAKDYFSVRRWSRRLCMPQFESTYAAEHAADAVAERCNVFQWLKQVKRLPQKRMSHETLKKLGLV